MFKFKMINKGFTETKAHEQTPTDIIGTEKPLKTEVATPNRVDINVLKSRIQEKESKEYKQNVFIFVIILIAISAIGIYLSI